MSSKPTTATSSGTRRPASCSARIAPKASRSLKQNTASSSGRRDSSAAHGVSSRRGDGTARRRPSGRDPPAGRLVAGPRGSPAGAGRQCRPVGGRCRSPRSGRRPSSTRCSIAVPAAATLSMATWSTPTCASRSPSSTIGCPGGSPLDVLAGHGQRAGDGAVGEVVAGCRWPKRRSCRRSPPVRSISTVKPAPSAGGGNVFGQLREVRRQLGQRQRDQPGTSVAQATGGQVGPVAQFVDHRLHLGPGFHADERVIVHHVGHGLDRDTRDRCHVFETDRHGQILLRRGDAVRRSSRSGVTATLTQRTQLFTTMYSTL